jgi:hypothetical protein
MGWCSLRRLLAGAALRAVDYLQAVRCRLQLRDRVADVLFRLDPLPFQLKLD